MPGLTLTDALRYFFAPFVVFMYLTIYDSEMARKLQYDVGSAGTVAFLVAGSAFYFVYRYLVYNPIILWLHDVWRKQTYRRYLAERYEICNCKFWFPACSLRAQTVYRHIQFPKDRRGNDLMQTTAAGVHLLYQACLLALPFLVLSISKSNDHHPLFFAIAVLLFGLTAILADKSYEEDELIQLKGATLEADTVAELCGFAKRTNGKMNHV